MRPHRTLLVLAMLLSVVGCSSGPRDVDPNSKGKITRAPKEPPPYPREKPVPLDPALAATARKELGDALRVADPVVRIHALEAIRLTTGNEHKADIIRCLSDPEAIVRFAAALAAGELRLHEAHDALLAIAEDRSENVRVAVRFALHRIGDTHLSHQLEKMAQDPNPVVRTHTALVLGLIGEPSALGILRVMRRDHDATVRQQAAESMWRLHDDAALQDLVGLTVSKYYDDQMFAMLALAAPRDTRIRQYLRGGLIAESDGKNTINEVPLAAARGMGMLGSDEGYGVALQGAQSPDYRSRVLAAFAFGAIGRPDSQGVLGKLLKDQDPNVRIAAAAGILELKAPS
ncbi:MAG TPA: HEAT repeat domain-containing protein [Tepidisphaeraceae bacterium]|nr:HEAT repeat domain-containing protein [Tepidisphaeraceae bacterium]